MPSVSSSSSQKVLLSSTVMTPSLPTLSIASAIISPIAGSPAEMEAVEAICSLVSTSLASCDSCSLTRSTAASMPRLSDIGLAPAATFRSPSRTRAWASTVAVVVPSPATSSVFFATSLTSSAPIFSHGSSTSISLAMDTPSLVIVGAPHFFSSTTLRPLGPRVTFTASASWFMPRSRPRRASSSNAIIFAAIRSSPPWLACGSSRRPRRTARSRTVTSCREHRPHRPLPPVPVTLIGRVPTPCLALSPRECKRPAGRHPVATERGPRKREPARLHGGIRAGCDLRASDHTDSVSLLPSVALRNLKLHSLALFKRTVSVRLNCREVDKHVFALVYGDEAVALLRVEPLDGALSHLHTTP